MSKLQKPNTFLILTTILLCLVGLTILAVAAATAEQNEALQTVTITGEAKSNNETTASVAAIKSKEIKRIKPAHPAEILNRQAGVHVNNLGGEGHMTAIRQPISTDAAYLFLEDGLPTRPSGLFNHNALYEVNIPQAQRIEIIKGPGSALYGSESIGGIINTITEPSPEHFEMEVNPEFGSFGWKRLLISTGDKVSKTLGARLNFNMTDSEGYRDEADYSRGAVTLRLDGKIGERTRSKSILAFSKIEQSGVDSLDFDRYQAQSTYNRFANDVGRRNVDAFRLSNEFTTRFNAKNKLTVTPYFRDNQMELMPSWMLTYDPNDRDYQFQSYGVNTRFGQQVSNTFEWILGLDVDYSPSTYAEFRIEPLLVDDIYVSTARTGRTN